MNVGKNNNKIKREHDDDDDISIGTQDTYSTHADNEYKEDSFLLIETGDSQMSGDNDDENSFLNIKRDYLRRKKNLNRECCRRTLQYNEDYFHMRIREKELETEKLEKKKNNLKLKYDENVRNMKNAKILHEIRECKAAIRKAAIRKIIYKHKLNVYLKCNHEQRGGGGGGQGDMETNAE